MTKKRVRGRGKGKETAVKRQKNANAGNGKGHLKYDFDKLNVGKSILIPDADGMATPLESTLHNVKVLTREYAARHASSGIKFEVKKTEDGNVQCRRVA